MRYILTALLVMVLCLPVNAAQQIITNGDTMGAVRSDLNANFTELYGRDLNTDDQDSTEIDTVTTSFGNNLSVADDTVQKALDTLDNMSTSGGASAWLDLTDTPSSFTANYWVKVNSGGTALELVAAPTGTGDMLSTNNLSDVASNATARATLLDATNPSAASIYHFDGTNFSWATSLDIDVVLADEAPTAEGQITFDASNNGVRVMSSGSVYEINGSPHTLISGVVSLGTSAIASEACATVATATATGAATTDVISWSFNSDPTAVTGYTPLTEGMLTIVDYPTTNTVNFKVCNMTGSSITPGAITLNWDIIK